MPIPLLWNQTIGRHRQSGPQHNRAITKTFVLLCTLCLTTTLPTLVHRNLVETSAERNDVLALGAAGRIKLSKRITLNAEYIYVLPDQLAPGFRNSFSLGFDIETGGHVFQLHFTNSTSMIEKGFVTETNENWLDGGIHFGFNVSRVFTVVRPNIEE